jgi:hypothetical protein
MLEPVIQSTQDCNLNKPYKMLVYGAAGIGKTALIPTLNNPLILVTESGNPLMGLSGYNLPFVKITDFNHFLYCLNVFKNDARFSTIVIDSISDLSQMRINDLLKGKSNGGKKIHGEQAYGLLLQDFDAVFDLLNECIQDVVCFGKLHTFEAEDKKQLFYPLFAGKALNPIALHYFDAVVALDKQGGNRQLITSQNYQWQAKARTPFAIGDNHEPNLGKLLNKIRGING